MLSARVAGAREASMSPVSRAAFAFWRRVVGSSGVRGLGAGWTCERGDLAGFALEGFVLAIVSVMYDG